MSKKTLNQSNLEALGAAQLAALLMEVSTGSADIKRRLRLELSHHIGPSELARDVRKRLATLRKSTSFVGWRKRKALLRDLTTQMGMITDKIAPEDPTLAFDLMWDFVDLAPSVFGRVDDSRGEVGVVFRDALDQVETLAPRAVLAADTLAHRVWLAVLDNDFGQWDGIISRMAAALGPAGLAALKAHVEAHARAPIEADTDHEALQFLRQLRGGPTHATDRKARFVKLCLQEIAAAAGDTQAYIAQYSDADLQRLDISAEVALLLIQQGAAGAALDLLATAAQDGAGFGQDAWDVAYIATLEALDRSHDAQNHRWACFESTLNIGHLRDHLKRLPDFDDVEAEDKARALVLGYPDFSTALGFCLDWPDLHTASRLIETRSTEIDGDHYMLLTPAAEALRMRHPLAAVLLWRAMIDFALEQGRASRYGHAADHLADCAQLDGEIASYGTFASHAAYVAALEARHERKTSFWAKTR